MKRNIVVIWADADDIDSKVLSRTFKNIDVDLVHITKSIDLEKAEELVDAALKRADDFLIWLGHGTSYGLLYPDLEKGDYLIHKNNIDLIHAKDIYSMSCYVSIFAEVNNLKGFFTSMFISNVDEAYQYGITNYDINQITEVGELYCDRVNQLIKDEVPLDQWKLLLDCRLDIENEIEKFNYQGLIYLS